MILWWLLIETFSMAIQDLLLCWHLRAANLALSIIGEFLVEGYLFDAVWEQL